jgi:16S rRNA (guanine966-N2)-methyltransferase
MEKIELRIVAGALKGRKVECEVHEGLRPTPQAVREALFSILGNAVPGRVFYDVFSGSGVVGFEAISRGASGGRLIEFNPRQATTIMKYAGKFGVADRVQVLRADAYRWAERWIPTADQPVNLYLSPPFPDLEGVKVFEFLKLITTLFAKAPDDSVLVVQAEEGFPVEDLPDAELWDVRQYGRNLLMFRVKDAAEDEPTPADEVET